jgi:hypothetical protein
MSQAAADDSDQQPHTVVLTVAVTMYGHSNDAGRGCAINIVERTGTSVELAHSAGRVMQSISASGRLGEAAARYRDDEAAARSVGSYVTACVGNVLGQWRTGEVRDS